MPDITIQIVGWNSQEHLKNAAKALAIIPNDKVIIRYIDNASTDHSIETIRRLLPQADIMALSENKGFAGAHNIGLSKCSTPFVLTHDPDVVLNWSGIEKLLAVFQDEKVAAVQGKLLRPDGTIDSAGIIQTLTLNGQERGAGETDRGQYEVPANLLAVTGACGLYRLSALQKVAYSPEEFFDNQFFAYKEDVDMGWRLQRTGFLSKYEPIVVGTHARMLGQRGSLPWFIIPAEIGRRLRSPRTHYSIRNYIWMVVKNITPGQILIHGIFIIARLLYIFLLTLFVPSLFSVWSETLRFLPVMLKKRVKPYFV